MPTTDEGVRTVPEQTAEQLNERQLIDYQSYMKQFVKWMLNVGKDPKRAEGYSEATADTAVYQVDKFHRYVWEELEEGYTLQFTTDHGDAFLDHLALQDWKQSYKASLQKSLKRLFRFRHQQHGGDEWIPEYNFYDQSGAHQPRDYLSKEERGMIREAALEYGSIPTYNNISVEERSQWKAYLAQRFEKPKHRVTKRDWKKANSWKFPSLVWTSLDTGLRPIEVNRAVTSWVDTEHNVLRIPKEDSSKNTDNWVVALSSRTVRALERWMEEREYYEKYQDNDKLWLTRQANPYNSDTLAYLIKRLCEIAGIDYENRQMSWYTIRHSVGTEMSREEGLRAAQVQLRHKDQRTTMRYDQAPVENRQDALERMG